MTESTNAIQHLRSRVDALNQELLKLLQERASTVLEIARIKQAEGLPAHDPEREEAMLAALRDVGDGPLASKEITRIFRSIFRSSIEIQEQSLRAKLRIKDPGLLSEGGVRVGQVLVGGPEKVIIAGPCSVESAQQMEELVAAFAELPAVKILRGGAWKPRTNPYSFQGLHHAGLKLLMEAAKAASLPVVTEVLDTSTLPDIAPIADMLQVGARNMYNTELLKALGKTNKPILLKRGFMATIDEFLYAAEYVVSAGNPNVVLCERGIRTFERSTRNTLDISAVPIIKSETSLPIIVDLSHALGRRDIMIPCGRAALAAGADGIMVEVHPRPDQALSDSLQQMDLSTFRTFLEALGFDRE